jgi:aminoglycoside phosphotransferase (APT) family kinase protein
MTDVAVAVPASTLAWAARCVGDGATIVDVRQLRRRSGPWLLRIEGASVVSAVLKAGPAVDWRGSYACEIAALELAAQHDLPVPRVLGSQLDAAGDDWVSLVISYVDGEQRIPSDASAERLHALGRFAARLHRIALTPRAHLPLRVRHTGWVDFSGLRRAARRFRAAARERREQVLEELLTGDFAGWPREELRSRLDTMESSPLIDTADERLHETPMPPGPSVFVHGDLWQGNTLWAGDALVGVIDWETAGSGRAGVDLGCLRWDSAVLFGPSAPDEVLAGWEDETGRTASDLAYWDVVAALNTPADMRWIVPAIHEAGRTDLDADTLNARQEEFLTDALRRLDGSGA